MWQNKNILVTGGRGMIGQELIELLDKLGADVRVADIKKGCDLRDFDNCLQACEGMDFVFHLAGVKGSPKLTNEKPADFMGPMLQFDTNMILAAQLQGVRRFLYTSSIAVLNPETDKYPAWAKQTAEHLIEAQRIQNKGATYVQTEYCIVRPSNVYGRFDDFSNPNAMVITSLIGKAHSGSDTLEVWGDGSQTRDFVYAKDVAKGMMLVLEKLPTTPINLGSGYNTKISEVAEIIAKLCGKEVLYDKSKGIGAQNRPMDITEATKLGFKVNTSIPDGLKEVIKCQTLET